MMNKERQERSSDSEIERLRKRVQELEEENRFQLSETHKNLDKTLCLDKENQRYKRALEFYADKGNYELDICYDFAQVIDCVVLDDSGHQARQALRGESDLIGASETIL